MKTLHVDVANKRATFNKADGPIVCGNADYQIEFSFDEEWAAHDEKVAEITIGSKRVPIKFTGNICPLPILSRVVKIEVGVYVDEQLATTSAEIPCLLSCRCKGASETITFPEIPEYNGETELLVPTVSGVWVFNETLVNIPNEKTEVDVTYTMGNDITYNGLSFIYTDTMFPTDEPEIEFYAGGDWNDEAFKTIDFGSEPQEVSEAFYAWLAANAVKQ